MESDLPGSLATILVADLRGYTAYTHQQGDEAGGRVSESFFALCREVLVPRGGEIFASAGDQVLLHFPSARNALRAAVALQAKLADERAANRFPLQAGVGLDAGEVVRVGSDYRGGAINLAARLCAIAAGGDILASETVIDLARSTEGLVFLDRGEVVLKGLSSPIRVIQIAPQGVDLGDLPPLQPILVTRPTNLPDEPTPFLGRTKELTEITALLRQPEVRLVTLTGPGGTGKTRLALQAGAGLLERFPDGVFFVSLAAIADPDLFLSALADVLAVREEGALGLMNAIVAHLQQRELMLVLDNMEHLLPAAPTVAALLDACRRLLVLVTSRVPLHLSREHEYPVPPLALPDLSRLPPPERLSQYDAVALFIDRARAINPDFTVDAVNAPSVAEICFRLDGLPLAIELAAARVRLFPPAALLQRLNSRLKLLTGGARDRPSRQQTLRGAIDWSYSLLSEEERVLFARFAVFAGGCDFEAWEAVCGADSELDVVDGLTSLVEKSLVRQEDGVESRFRMLETIREYAAEKLVERGSEGESLRETHAAFFVERGETLLEQARRSGWNEYLTRLPADVDNLRAALRWSLDTGRTELSYRLCRAAWNLWYSRGDFREGLAWLDETLRRGRSADPALQAYVLRGAGTLHESLGDLDRGTALIEESLALARQIGDGVRIVAALNSLAIIKEQLGDLDRAETLLEEAAAIARQQQNDFQLSVVLVNRGSLARTMGDRSRAEQYLEESLALKRRMGNTEGEANVLVELGKLALAFGDLTRAAEMFAASQSMMEEMHDPVILAEHFAGVACLASARGEAETAARLFGAADAIWRRTGAVVPKYDAGLYNAFQLVPRTALGENRWRALWVEGVTMDRAVAVSVAGNTLNAFQPPTKPVHPQK